MFTIEQIKTAHARVKSGADFPTYIYELKNLGVISYDTFVADGTTVYFGKNGYQLKSPPKYEPIIVSGTSDIQEFKAQLSAHQHGQSDYYGFCVAAAQSGIEKWSVSMDDMTCTYFDSKGKKILVEHIREPSI